MVTRNRAMRNVQSHTTVNPSFVQINEDPHHLKDVDLEQLEHQGITQFGSMFSVGGNIGPKFGNFVEHATNIGEFNLVKGKYYLPSFCNS